MALIKYIPPSKYELQQCIRDCLMNDLELNRPQTFNYNGEEVEISKFRFQHKMEFYIRSDTYVIHLTEYANIDLNGKQYSIKFFSGHKSTSYYDVLEVLNNVDVVFNLTGYNDELFVPQKALMELHLLKNYKNLDKIKYKTVILYAHNMIYKLKYCSIKPNLDHIKKLKTESIVICVDLCELYEYKDKLFDIVSNIPFNLHLGLAIDSCSDLLIDKCELFAYSHVKSITIYRNMNNFGYYKSKETYSREKYLDRLNLRRLQLHYRKLTIAHHPMLNRDTLNLITSFLYKK